MPNTEAARGIVHMRRREVLLGCSTVAMGAIAGCTDVLVGDLEVEDVEIDEDGSSPDGPHTVVSGRVVNDWSGEVPGVRVTVRLLDADGSVVAEEQTTVQTAIPEGYSEPFTVTLPIGLEAWDDYEIDLEQGPF